MKIVFLDRDGVINEDPGSREYVKTWEEFHFLPGVKSALKKLSDNRFKIFMISNQAGVAKGLYSKRDLDFITKNMLEELGSCDISISGVYYCIHKKEDDCPCRKPKTGLIDQVVKGLRKERQVIEISQSYFVGDSIRDIETGKSAGLRTILVFSGKEKPDNRNNWQTLPDFTAQDLSRAVKVILKTK